MQCRHCAVRAAPGLPSVLGISTRSLFSLPILSQCELQFHRPHPEHPAAPWSLGCVTGSAFLCRAGHGMGLQQDGSAARSCHCSTAVSPCPTPPWSCTGAPRRGLSHSPSAAPVQPGSAQHSQLVPLCPAPFRILQPCTPRVSDAGPDLGPRSTPTF